jgi:hypothetical protein
MQNILALDSSGFYLKKLENNMVVWENADQYAKHKNLMDSLDYRKDLDQKERGRASTKEEWEKQKAIDSNNREFLQDIIDSIGVWPGFTEVGKTGESAAFLIIQHSEDSVFQFKGLKLMSKALESNNIDPQHYAMLLDRYTLNILDFQLFGTQIEMVNKHAVAKKLYDKNFVDAIRLYFLLPPLHIYLESMSKINN